MVAQLTYGSTPPVATPGMIAEHFSGRQIDSYLAGGTIPFGAAVTLSTTDPDQVVAGTVPADTFVGIAVFAQQLNEQDFVTGEVSYKQYDQVPVISNGRVWVKVSIAVDFGDPAYALPDGSGNFTNVALGNIDVGASFRTTTAGAGLAIIEL